MATSPEENQQDQDEFAAAFAGADPVKTEMSEDEAFGPGPIEEEPEMIEAEDDESGVDMGESAGAGAAGDDVAGAEPSITIAVEPGAEDNANTEPVDPKDLQRQKSWEGRLKAREAELAAREKALGVHAGEGETMAEDAAEPASTEAMEEAVAKVESGELTFDQAMATLSNDFGEDFTKMLGVLIEAKAGEIAGKTADERVSKVSQQMDGLVGELVDDKARMHFESISDAHEDFMDIAASPEFKEYISAMDETQRAAAEQTIESGSARNIIKLLSNFKAAGAKAEPVDDESMDAAEGVRSSGLKIPNKPAASEDYEAAWNSF